MVLSVEQKVLNICSLSQCYLLLGGRLDVYWENYHPLKYLSAVNGPEGNFGRYWTVKAGTTTQIFMMVLKLVLYIWMCICL